MEECNELLKTGEIKFLVTFEIAARYLLSDDSICSKLFSFLVIKLKNYVYRKTKRLKDH